MSLLKKIALASIASSTLFANLAKADLFDDFSSGSLNPNLWQVRADVEGQPLMDEYGVSYENGNYAFHTQQNTIADRRVYLVPNYQFKTGDVLNYDYDVISREGHYSSMILLTGDQYIRIGISGYNNGTGEIWNGLIDDVRVYNRALSADEIKRLYNLGR